MKSSINLKLFLFFIIKNSIKNKNLFLFFIIKSSLNSKLDVLCVKIEYSYART